MTQISKKARAHPRRRSAAGRIDAGLERSVRDAAAVREGPADGAERVQSDAPSGRAIEDRTGDKLQDVAPSPAGAVAPGTPKL